MLPVAAVFQVLVSVALLALILMHSGRDAGLGGMGFTPASQGGTHIVERNLTRLTVVMATIFFLNSVIACSPSPGRGYTARPRAGGGIGRRARLRALWPSGRGGSSPLQRTVWESARCRIRGSGSCTLRKDP